VVATMRGRKSAPWLWASGLSLAAVSSWLRIAADRHYLTDVLAGAALGSLMGVSVPVVFHGVHAPVTVAPQVSASGGGLVISGSL
jgi:membrane-associated phospholipid phosphatase